MLVKAWSKLLLLLILVVSTARAQENIGVPWPATDDLGRSLPLIGEAGPPRTNRFVGIFYFIDHLHWPRSEILGGPYDVAEILKRDPDALQKPEAHCRLVASVVSPALQSPAQHCTLELWSDK